MTELKTGIKELPVQIGPVIVYVQTSSFIQQILIKGLLHARHCSLRCRYSREKSNIPALMGLTSWSQMLPLWPTGCDCPAVVIIVPGETEKPCILELMDDVLYEEVEELRLVLGTPQSNSPFGAVVGEQNETLIRIDHEAFGSVHLLPGLLGFVFSWIMILACSYFSHSTFYLCCLYFLLKRKQLLPLKEK